MRTANLVLSFLLELAVLLAVAVWGEALARELDKTHPGVAGSLREGLAETLTVLRLGVPPALARTLRSTNAIEGSVALSEGSAWEAGSGTSSGLPSAFVGFRSRVK
jgi:hypothetical protein